MRMIQDKEGDRVGFPFSWEHVQEFVEAKYGTKIFDGKKMRRKGQPCDLCQGKTLQLHCKSPDWTWQSSLCGRECHVEVCFACKAWRHYGIFIMS